MEQRGQGWPSRRVPRECYEPPLTAHGGRANIVLDQIVINLKRRRSESWPENRAIFGGALPALGCGKNSRMASPPEARAGFGESGAGARERWSPPLHPNDTCNSVAPCGVGSAWAGLTLTGQREGPSLPKMLLSIRWVWLRGLDLNQRPLGYESSPGCLTD